MKKWDDSTQIEAARDHKVIKSNAVLQTVTRRKNDLTALELKELDYIISLIKPPAVNEDPILRYTFDIQHFCAVCGINTSGKNYKNLKYALQRLSDHSFWIETADGKQILLRWITEAIIDPQTKEISVLIGQSMVPYLFDLKKRFTSFELKKVLALKSSYSILLYELLKSYAFQRKHLFKPEELMQLIQSPYQLYKDFNRRCLKPAIADINTFTDLDVSCTAYKKGTKIYSIEFIISDKSEAEKDEADRQTIAKINGMKPEAGQMNIFEYLEGGN